MVARRRVQLPTKTSFEPGHKKVAGRKKGVPNRLTRDMKEAAVEALIEYGRDGKGKDALKGFVRALLEKNLENGLALYLKIMAFEIQVSGKDGGPIQVFSLPPELLKGLAPHELKLMEAVLTKIATQKQSMNGGQGPLIEGSAERYAEGIGDDDTRH